MINQSYKSFFFSSCAFRSTLQRTSKNSFFLSWHLAPHWTKDAHRLGGPLVGHLRGVRFDLLDPPCHSKCHCPTVHPMPRRRAQTDCETMGHWTLHVFCVGRRTCCSCSSSYIRRPARCFANANKR